MSNNAYYAANRRETFLKLKAQWQGFPVTPHFLRQDVALGAQNTFDFGFSLESLNTQLPQRLLNRSDLFHITRIGYFAVQEITAKRGKGVLQTYANAQHFTGMTDVTDLNYLWNGSLSVKVDLTEEITAIDTRNFFCIPQSQASATIASVQNGLLAESDGESGFYMPPVGILLNGSKKNTVRVELPSPSTAAGYTTSTSGSVNYLVVKLEGFLITGANGRM